MQGILDSLKRLWQRVFGGQPGRRVVGGARETPSGERPHPTAPIIPPGRRVEDDVPR